MKVSILPEKCSISSPFVSQFPNQIGSYSSMGSVTPNHFSEKNPYHDMAMHAGAQGRQL